MKITNPKKLPLPERLKILVKAFGNETQRRFGQDEVPLLEVFIQGEYAAKHPQTGEVAALTININETSWYTILTGCESPEAEEKANTFLDRVTGKLGLDWDMIAKDESEVGLIHFWPSVE
jgi:hypothetical protein